MSDPGTSELLDRVAALERALALIADVEQVRHLRERYCLYVDGKRWDDLLDLLTPDYRHLSTNEVGSPPVLVAEGPAAFVDRLRGLTAGATTVHACTMPTITRTSIDEAAGHWSMTDVVSHPTDARMRFSGHGHYDDTYRRGPDGVWRIAVTRLTRSRLDPLPLREEPARGGSLHEGERG